MANESHHHLFFPNNEFMSVIENYNNMQTSFMVPPVNSLGGGDGTSAVRKRQRDDSDVLSFFAGDDDVALRLHQQWLDIDYLLGNYEEKMRKEMEEKRKRAMKEVMVAVEEMVMRRMRAKEQEMEMITKFNWALEEKIRSLAMENQVWRDVAQSNETAAIILQRNLELVLAKEKEEEEECAGVEDVESCWWGGSGEEEGYWRRRCRSCGVGEVGVVVLPCRHLCVCLACAAGVVGCPVCRAEIDDKMFVNMSL
ncbi:E3 ubiquitin-protein ligase BOI-like protein [Dioscorea alata]|uniref:E3 ubiquitin-protein ligase BOI-like protein n=1 Tax=Dioscorea alata TaxID=55571 RepID=A0ACB7VHT9_DIOAL|nr:E3 ubiquitin-protein ligase BOI-like protein [Dioscorea alata]